MGVSFVVHAASVQSIRENEAIRFIVTNTGRLTHEFSIGNSEMQKSHAAMMRLMPGMTHADATTVTIQPGETQELSWRFSGKENLVFSYEGNYMQTISSPILFNPTLTCYQLLGFRFTMKINYTSCFYQIKILL